MRKAFVLVMLSHLIVIGNESPVSVQIQAEHPFSFTDESIAISCSLKNNGTNVIPVLSFPPDNRRGQIFFSDPASLNAHTKARMSKEYYMIRTYVAEAEDILMVSSNMTCRVEIDPITLSFSTAGTYIQVAHFYLGNGEWIESNTITAQVVVAEEKSTFKTLVPDVNPYDIVFHVLKYQGTNYLMKSRQNIRIAEIPVGKSFDINWDDRQRYAVVTVEGQTNTVYDVRMLRRIWPPVTIP